MEEEKKEVEQNETSQEVKIEETEHSIPYSRFKEVIEERNEKEKQLKKLLKEKEDMEKKKLEETEQFKTLYEKTKKELEDLNNEKRRLDFEFKKRELIEKKKISLPKAYLRMIEYTEDDEILEKEIEDVLKQYQEDFKEVKKIGSPTSPAETENIGDRKNPPDPVEQPELYKAWLKKYFPEYAKKQFK